MVKIGIICSPGGHFIQTLLVMKAFEGNEVFLITYESPTLKKFSHSGIQKIYFIKYFGDTGWMMFFTLMVSFFYFLRIFYTEKPNVLFSTGAEIAIPGFLIGKYLFRAKLIFLETLTRINTPSTTAKVIYHISDLFLVQWESLLKKFGERAKFAGSLL
jgi:UDP-N-acetylglucosamine:LPS N-acetylglucosamine transferase